MSSKMSAWQIGRPKPEETRKKISAALTGHKQSPETIAKRAASLKGRVFTPEHRAKISAALKGKHRRTHCPHGHAYDEGNARLITTAGGEKVECRTCRSQKKKAKRDRDKESKRSEDRQAPQQAVMFD